MSVKKIKDLIAQINAPNEIQLDEVDLANDNLYYIWKAATVSYTHLTLPTKRIV